MGYALITGNLTKGRYSIELDYGNANRNQRAAQISAVISALNVRLANALISEASAQSLYDASKVALDAFISTWAFSGAPIVPGSPKGKEHEQLLKASLFLSIQLQRSRSVVANLKLLIAKQQRALTALQALILVQQRQAWCIDLTQTASGYVATAEIPGESNLVLIKPGAPAWTASDGVLVAREVMDPNQAYFNAAILPGWQKFKPTFRRGTIIALNRPQHKATVALADHESSAQRLPVDQQSILSGIPVTYMSCHSNAFDVGDQVVVRFDGQDQTQPRVIGFVTDPKGCTQYILRYDRAFGVSEVYRTQDGPKEEFHTVYQNRDGPVVTAMTPFFNPGFNLELGVGYVWLGWGYFSEANDFAFPNLQRQDLKVQRANYMVAQYLSVGGAIFQPNLDVMIVLGVPLTRKTLIFRSSTADYEVISGPSGTYNSGYVTYAEAEMFMVGSVQVARQVRNGINIEITLVLGPPRYDNPGGSLQHFNHLVDVSTLYANY